MLPRSFIVSFVVAAIAALSAEAATAAGGCLKDTRQTKVNQANVARLLDYLCTSRNPAGCPKPSLAVGVLKQIEQREKHGVYTHILAFHELSSTTAVMPELISTLKARGYRFVTLTEYMHLVAPKP